MFLRKNKVNRLYDRREEESLPFIRDRRSLLISIMLLSLIIILSIRYPGPLTTVEWLFQSVGLPTHSGDNGMGWHFANLFVIALLVVVLIFMDRALNHNKFIAFIVIVMLVGNAPGWLTTNYQRLFASGVYAVEVDPSQVRCNYVLKEHQFTGTCQLKLKNNSRDLVEVVPAINFSEFWRLSDSNIPVLPVITLSPVRIPPRSEGVHTTEFNMKVDSDVDTSGSTGGDMSITLNDGVHERSWE
ncbi:hypothetical protein ACP8HI_11065 [Paenibacillus sp. FA6]|uniref:hypothetical protein n=1 Tax=Paenibacillus sp. FA6 TaxID=3413029 RepID=UPI003F6586CC